MHLSRPLLAATAALTLTAGVAPAFATSSTSTPSKGTARSALTLLEVSLAGHTVTAGTVEGVASDATSRLAQLVVTPISLDGTAHGQQTITPSQAPATVPSSPQSVSIANLLSVTGPTLALDAKAGPTAVLTSAVLKALGSIDLKPAGLVDLPLNLQTAALTNLAQVTSSQSEAEKTVTLGSLSLPSVNGLLSGLGVDLTKLLDQLTQGNLNTLSGLVSGPALTTLNNAVDTAQAALSNAPDTLAAATAQLATANTALASANSALTTATTAFNSALSTALGNPALAAALGAVGISGTSSPSQVVSLVGALDDTLKTAAQTAVDAQTAVTAAQTLVNEVNALIDALQALVNAVLGAVTSNSDPLAALGNITVTTKAIASQSSPLPVASASVGSLNVLGVSTPVAQLTSALGSVLNTLSGVLNSVTGITFTAPTVSIGTPHTSTSTQGTTHKANASITGVTVTLPTIKLPATLSTVTQTLPGASLVNGVVSVLGGSVKVGDLTEAADFTPAVAGSTPSTPQGGSSNPSLANTGLSRTVPAIAALLIVAALAVMHRRRRLSE